MAKERVERDEEDLVRLYLTDIGQYPLLTKDDEVRLAQAIEAGAEAREEFEKVDVELTILVCWYPVVIVPDQFSLRSI